MNTLARTHTSAMQPRRTRLALALECALTALAAPVLMLSFSAPALADDGTPCSPTNGQNCVINATGSTGGQNKDHSGQGGGNPTPSSINRNFTDTQTYTASDGSYGAIDFRLIGGAGGAATSGLDGHGKNGGTGGAGGAITVTTGSNVSTTGAYDGGLQRFLSQGGGGGGAGGHDTLTGQSGTGGTGGAGGTLQINTAASASSTDVATSGIEAISVGGNGAGGTDGQPDFFAPYAGAGGGGGAVTLSASGAVTTSATGVYVRSQGGQGGQGPNDNGGTQADGRNGGQGGGSSTVNVTITGNVTATGSGQNGVDVGATGGGGGAGGYAQGAPEAIGGNGGNGGNGGTPTVVVTGARVSGAEAGVMVNSNGGDGAAGGYGNGSGTSSGGNGGGGGTGGQAGTATATIQGNAQVSGGLEGALVYANGGRGGAGGTGQATGTSGGNGGAGGGGGAANANIGPASVSGAPGAVATAVAAISAGGDGGAGAAAGGGSSAVAGNGGNGGAGGAANVQIQSGGSVATTAADTPSQSANATAGVLARSNGGVGGAGGNASAVLGAKGGGAGFGGTGGSATALIDGSVSTTGSTAHGVLAQSVGGAGGGGGEAASLFFSQGGAAHNGATGGTVTVGGNGGTIQTAGSGSAGVVAQSIGGGGGSAGNALTVGIGVSVAIGGNGGGGGNGGAVRVGQVAGDASTAAMNDTVITRGNQAAGIVAQSVGGAGGHGGNAVSAGTAPVHLVIGGDGKGGSNGGAGGQVDVNNAGLVTTFGSRAGGVLVQSIGGGGGIGGATFAASANVLNIGVAVGGQGSGGGSGGNVNLNNTQQVTTYGNDAYGLSAQSIAGGGGHGGATTDVAVAVGLVPDLPTVAIDVAVGGSGGAGGNQSQSTVTLNNGGFVSTAGEGAIGVLAQNIAGGGGTGGDSSALSYAYGDGATVSVAVGAGGNGGGSGTGGAVNVNNNGLVMTMGGSSHGIVAQSVGGGGGIGGAGDSSALGTGTDSRGVSVGLSVGGQGGSGSAGGTVTVVNNAGVGTRGDGSRGILAQSIGGGGGASGGGAAVANGQDLSAAVTVGGSAGAGGNGGSATVTNKGTIVTNGADSDGILVQSVGGGGGLAGKGSSTAGTAATPGQTAAALLSSVTNGLGVGKGVTPIADKVFKVGDGILADVNNVKEVQKALGVGGDSSSDGTLSVAATGDDNDSGIAKGIQLGLTVGGKGGGGGSGGTAGASNAGNILTAGSRADGIMVQSIGGGGGVGGATTFSGTLGQNSTGNASLALGANGANGGAAGTVTATNAAGASIITSGIMAHGMVGQSIGGGGGDAGIQGNTGGALANLSVVVGGSGGASGAGGAVTLDNEGAVQTQGSYASGMVAQSVGGGGGTATVLSSNAVTASIGSMQLSLGGRGGKASDGGAVTVNSAQTGSGLALLETQGQGSVGVLAQSIGGGGGSLQVSDGTTGTLPGTLTLPLTLGGGDGASGNGGAVTLNLGSAGKSALISTGGQDAHGVVVQSIGGGGGLVAGASNTPGALATLFGAGAHQGNGGAVALNLQSANVNTSGDGATALFAQSIGGGGGLFGALSQFTPGSTIQSTPVSTSGQGGNVNVNLNGADITTYGARAHGVWAQAFGGGGGVMGSSDGTGVTFAGASPYAGCSGSACTGAINVALTNGASINVNGPQSYGVYVQSRGNGVNDTTISLDSTSAIETSDPTGIAIFVDGAGTNTIKNSGVIVANEGNGVALAGNQPANLINDTNSTFSGSIKLPKGNSAFSNMPGATFNAGDTVDLGAGGLLSNAGTLTVGGAHMAQTNVHGQLQQTASGRTVIDVDTVGRRNDSLVVDGSASLAGTVLLHPTTLSPTSFNVLSASGSLTTDPALRVQDGGGNLLFGYGTTVSGNGGAAAAGGLSKPDAGGATLSVTPYSKLGTAAVQGGLGANRNALAMHLDAGFGGGTTPAQGAVYAQLATLGSLPAYSNALDNLSGELLQSANITRVASSVTLAERMNTAHCAGRGDMGELAPEADCNWARVTESRTSRDGTADEAGFGMSNSALQAGAQRRIAEGWFAGGAVSYDNTRLHANGVDQSVDGSSGSVAGVLKYQTGPWTFSGSADLGYGSYDSTRHIAFAQTVAQAKGDFHMWHAGLHGRIAYAMPMDGFYLRPYLDLHAVRVQTSDNRETGAGALDLQASGGGQNFFAASPMLEIGTPDMKLGGMEVRGYAAIGATLSKESQASGQARLEGWAAAPGVQPFQVNSSIPERRGRVELGATLLLGHGQELTLSYGGEFAGGFRSNSGTVKYRYVF